MRESVRLVVEALESGKYLQGYGTLRRLVGISPYYSLDEGSYDGESSRFCCMGVISDLVPDLEFQINDSGRYLYGSYEPMSGYLSAEAMIWLGVKSRNPRVWWQEDGVVHRSPLGSLNDDLHFSFPRIAAILRIQKEDWNGMTFDGDCPVLDVKEVGE